MRWEGRRQSDNVEDMRGSGGGRLGGGGMRIPIRAGGGGGIGLIILALVLWLGFGINPLQLLGMMEDGGNYQTSQTSQGPGVQGTPDKTDDFVATVLADTEDVWNKRFQDMGRNYQDPTLVLFSGQVNSACGSAQSAMGPFYCPRDQKLYIDLSFFRQLAGQLNSPGDFAQAYVVAHEVGHHVQNLLGTLPKTDALRQRASSQEEANAVSVRVELQADCYAGIFAHDDKNAGYLDPDDIDEALNAASQIGDDTLQKESQGRVVPDSFTHGTSQQRVSWFKKGFDTGDMRACDTFGGSL
ncbi:flagellar biosynthesis protein FlgM [Aureimonas endophytica]|uniref:Flagellar biosynthesis protein FlgM n=1 Tax=Aureimonas endophytica TaxID=2027858 RepID=A0A916ZUF2_9HYPH|nr:neutral zinc metallopeptidase [Aureimonas endophytica]GGE14667.1 flagellar biosynthesis protein FlgM [Aureimonas endophytica]